MKLAFFMIMAPMLTHNANPLWLNVLLLLIAIFGGFIILAEVSEMQSREK
jgi:hypothetical protein